MANTFEETDDMYWAWEKLLTDVLNDHAPLVEKKSTKPRPPPYFNSEMMAAIHCRNQVRQKCYTIKEPNNWKNYQQQKNCVVSMRRKAIKESLAQQCSTSNGNPSEFWFSRKSYMNKSIQLSDNTNIIQDKHHKS